MKSLTMAVLLALSGPALAQLGPDGRQLSEQTQVQAAQARAKAELDEARAKADDARARADQKRAQAQLEQRAAGQHGALMPLDPLGAGELSARAPSEEEALAIAALEGLMAAPPERALPLLKRVLGGQKSDLVKARALFVLSQFDGTEAQSILLDVAKRGSLPLRGEAVRMIGIGGRPEALAALQSMYASEPALREEILGAYLIAGRKDALLSLAQNSKGEDLAAIVRTLGAMGAVDELRKLGDAGKHSEALVQAFAISGDVKSLENLARTAKDRNIQLEAVRNIGIAGTGASAALSSIYQSSSDAEIKEAALQGLMIAGDEKGLMSLYRSAKSPAEKKQILRTLTMLGGDAAIEAIDAALGNAP